MADWTAHVSIKWNKNADIPQDWNWLKDWSEVKGAWSTMGDWDMTLWVDTQNPTELENFVHSKLRELGWVADTKTTWTKQVWAA